MVKFKAETGSQVNVEMIARPLPTARPAQPPAATGPALEFESVVASAFWRRIKSTNA